MVNRNTSSRGDEVTQYFCFNGHREMLTGKKTETVDDARLSHALKEGTTLFDQYEILKMVKENHVGFVYLVEKHDPSRSKFIIKEFFPTDCVVRGDRDQMLIKSFLNTDELLRFNFMRKIFLKEARDLSKIYKNRYPDTTDAVRQIENRNNTIYTVMPYEEGTTLSEYIEKEKTKGKQRLSRVEVYQIMNALCDTLEQIHDLGIYHLDIKPENILIKKDDSILLTGLQAGAVFLDDRNGEYCSVYTPKYASPEQIDTENLSKIDQRSDIYSMGVLFHYLITGVFPSKADDRMEAMIVKGRADPYESFFVQSSSGEYSNFFLVSVDKALSFSKKNRFYSVNDFRNSILGISFKEPKENKSRKIVPYLAALMIPLVIYFGWKNFTEKPDSQEVQKSDLVIKKEIRQEPAVKSMDEPQKIDENSKNAVSDIKIKTALDEDKKIDNKLQKTNNDEEKQSADVQKAKEDIAKDEEIGKTESNTSLTTTSQTKEIYVEYGVSVNTEQTVPAKQESVTGLENRFQTTYENNESIENDNKMIPLEEQTSSNESNIVKNSIKIKKKPKKRKRTKKLVNKKIKRKSKIKNRSNKTRQDRKFSKQKSTGLVWYCSAKAVGTLKIRAKHSSRSTAKNLALQRCNMVKKGQGRCKIVNCFLLRN